MLREQELDEKLSSLTEEDSQNLNGDELEELAEHVYGEEAFEGDEPEPPPLHITVNKGETKEPSPLTHQ